MSIIFGRVPHPAYQDRPIAKPEGRGQNNLGYRMIKGVVWHRILGSLWGTDTYFRRSDVNALTDYGIGVAAKDGAANDGLILRWNNPLGLQSGWASGPVNGAYGDGLAFVNKYGIDSVNRDQVSIEISGDQLTPLSEKSRQSIAALTAYFADQYHVPWDKFPIIPHDGFSFVRWHQEFTIGSGKQCPFKVVMDETPALIERTRAILKAWQENPEIELPVEEPVEQEPKPEEPKHELPKGKTIEALRRQYRTAVNPVTKQEEGFDLNEQASQMWLAHTKRTGRFPFLVQIIRRGDGAELYQWSDGYEWERPAGRR